MILIQLITAYILPTKSPICHLRNYLITPKSPNKTLIFFLLLSKILRFIDEKNCIDIIKIEWQHKLIPFGDVVKLADTLDLESSSERSESSSLSVPTIEDLHSVLILKNLY